MMAPQPQVMMMAPQPQVIVVNNTPTPAKKEPRTGWHTGLYECGNDIPVCASRPSCSPLKTARPRPAPIHARLLCMALPPPSRRTMPSPPLGTGLCSFCCFPCAYGMLIEMNLEDKVFQDTDSPMAVRARY